MLTQQLTTPGSRNMKTQWENQDRTTPSLTSHLSLEDVITAKLIMQLDVIIPPCCSLVWQVLVTLKRSRCLKSNTNKSSVRAASMVRHNVGAVGAHPCCMSKFDLSIHHIYSSIRDVSVPFRLRNINRSLHHNTTLLLMLTCWFPSHGKFTWMKRYITVFQTNHHHWQL